MKAKNKDQFRDGWYTWVRDINSLICQSDIRETVEKGMKLREELRSLINDVADEVYGLDQIE